MLGSWSPDVWMGPVDREAAAAECQPELQGAARGRLGRRLRLDTMSRGLAARRDRGSRDTRGAAKAGETASAGTDYEGKGKFSRIVAAVGKGKGAKKRKMLAERLAGAWSERDKGDGTMPAVPVLEVYRRMSGSMTSGVVRTELKV